MCPVQLYPQGIVEKNPKFPHQHVPKIVSNANFTIKASEKNFANSLSVSFYFIVAIKSIYIILRFGNFSHGTDNHKLSCF